MGNTYLSKARYTVSSNVNTCEGSRTELQAVKPAKVKFEGEYGKSSIPCVHTFGQGLTNITKHHSCVWKQISDWLGFQNDGIVVFNIAIYLRHTVLVHETSQFCRRRASAVWTVLCPIRINTVTNLRRKETADDGSGPKSRSHDFSITTANETIVHEERDRHYKEDRTNYNGKEHGQVRAKCIGKNLGWAKMVPVNAR